MYLEALVVVHTGSLATNNRVCLKAIVARLFDGEAKVIGIVFFKQYREPFKPGSVTIVPG